MTDYQATLACIDKILEGHAVDPFSVLRESGIQAELREHLLKSFPERVAAEIVQPLKPGLFVWEVPVSTTRVQLEMKVCFPKDATVQQRADLVVLRKDVTVQLTCHANGPGDVVAALRPEDVAVAVEIKASPSRTPEQRRKYASDLQRLLVLNEKCYIEGFFVLLDKSHPRFGSAAHPKWKTITADMNDWATLRSVLGPVNITTERPARAAAVATICYLCPEGCAAHVFVWK